MFTISSTKFKETELGDLKENNFWDLYYNYDVKDFKGFFKKTGELISKTGCRCDRKEHTVNKKIKESNIF